MFNVQNRIGSALGVVLLASLLGLFGTSTTSAAGIRQPLLVAYQFALLGSAAFLLVALFFALRIRNADVTAALPKTSPVNFHDAEPIAK